MKTNIKSNQSQKNISTEWQQVKLGDIGKVSMCKRIFKNETFSVGEIPFYKISTFGKKADAFISEKVFREYKHKYSYPKKGEILISASGTIGRVVVFDGEKSYFQDSNIVWISHSQNKILNKYLEQLYSITKWTSTDGGIISRLYNEDLKSIKFLLPPLPEQNRIVAVLEAWDGAIEKLGEKIEIKKRIKKGLMQDLLTGKKRLGGFKDKWEWVKLKTICNIQKGKQLNKHDMIIGGKYPALNGGIGASGYTNEWNTKENTITISEGGNSCGYLNFNKEKFWCGGHCYAINLNKNIDNLFLYQVLKLKQNKIMALRVGSGLPNIQKKALDDLKVIIPKSLKEQTAIANILTTADEEITGLEKKLSIIKNQKKYLLNNLITGKIRAPEFIK